MRIIGIDMCGRFTLSAKLEDLLDEFPFPIGAGQYEPKYNIAPTQQVLTLGAKGGSELQPMKWGLSPDWAANKKKSISLINARAESVLTKGTYSNSLSHRRCLILADGYYEWRTFNGGKVPFRIVLKGARPFAFAGLWNENQESEIDPSARSCTIVTCPSNEMLSSVHHRMPVILRQDDYRAWLNQDCLEPHELARMLQPYSPEKMEFYEVSQLVNSVKNDSSTLIRAIRP